MLSGCKTLNDKVDFFQIYFHFSTQIFLTTGIPPLLYNAIIYFYYCTSQKQIKVRYN
jgi:hypothetical protein